MDSGYVRQGDFLGEVNMDKVKVAMAGRSLLKEEFMSLLEYVAGKETAMIWEEIAQLGILGGWLQAESSIRMLDKAGWFARLFNGSRKQNEAECRRCGSRGKWIRWTECGSCGKVCPYCEACLTMGRARLCAPLIIGLGSPVEEHQQEVNLANFQLSEAQSAASEKAVQFLLDYGTKVRGEVKRISILLAKLSGLLRVGQLDTDQFKMLSKGDGISSSNRLRKFLIWAVTGAGKTEMMFPLIAAERSRGGRVLIATPRKDVVLELLPRVRAAFAGQSVAALYGGSEERWEAADITIATTHQLMRFEAAFDLVVLDELDAFPYHNNPMLAYAAGKACKSGGAFVMLSATPPKDLQRAARSGKLPHVKVPVRYHRHPLPVPAMAKPSRLMALLRESVGRGAQVFVFVPRIARLAPELRHVRQALADGCEAHRIDATSSQDPERMEKVRRFRAGDIRILLTTTILERGVTIAKADVLILDADAGLFDDAALVQMAGRAGRSASDPYGQVWFLARQRTRAQVRAIRHIRAMNRLAHKSGYLLREGSGRRGYFGK